MDELHSVLGAKRLEAMIRLWLMDGTLSPGQQLPTEQQLVGRYGVSSRTVRLVMIRLEAERLIRGEHGVGYFAGDRAGRRRW